MGRIIIIALGSLFYEAKVLVSVGIGAFVSFVIKCSEEMRQRYEYF